MRRLLAFAALAALLAGCSTTVPGGKKVTTPTPDTVVGKLPNTAGASVFASAGCGACHVFGPAGSTGTIGPDLDNLAGDAQKANQGTLAAFTKTSILDPSAYVAPGYPNGVMPGTYGATLTPQQIDDLVSFLTQGH